MMDVCSSRSCPVAKVCGACQSIHTPYAVQLAAKTEEIRALFEGVVDQACIFPILGMDEPYYYRNKVISPFVPSSRGKAAKGAQAQAGAGAGAEAATGVKGARGAKSTKTAKGAQGARGAKSVREAKAAKASGRTILTGMYAPHSHQLVDTKGCLVENQAANHVVQAIRSIMLKYGMQAYDEDTQQGFIRHVVVRVGHSSGEMLVTIVTNGEQFESSKAFCRELKKRCPEVTTIVQNINTAQTNVILGQKERTLYGPGFILDKLCGLSFRVSSQSFYQVNAQQTEVLYNLAMECADLKHASCIVDAYCGTGTIGLVAASRSAARVIGVDSVPAAIADARQNAAHNGIKNAEFVAQDAGAFMSALANKQAVDVLFMDPPRAGSSVEFLDAAAACNPARIVYISCNPQTQLRDIKQLARAGYEVARLVPVDMFPHTKHVETVALLCKDNQRNV